MDRRLSLFLCLTACGAPTEASWLEGYRFSWNGFNHRISYLEVDVTEGSSAQVGLVGGTSTTRVVFEDPDCVSDGLCSELPFDDDSTVDVRWARGTATREVLATDWVSMEVGPDGVETTALVELPRRRKGTAVALLSGLRLDTDRELPAEARELSCYDPRHGYNPTSLAVTLGSARVTDDRRSVEVPVSARFTAGLTLEEIRACLDAVAGEARVGIDVGITVWVGDADPVDTDVVQSARYELGSSSFSPDPQPDPAAEDITADLGPGALVGWSSLAWTFHDDDPDDRGAYLRTLQFDVDPEASAAFGHATNYSPVTQTSGFTYTFRGTVQAVEADLEVEHLSAGRDDLPAAIEDDGTAIPATLTP